MGGVWHVDSSLDLKCRLISTVATHALAAFIHLPYDLIHSASTPSIHIQGISNYTYCMHCSSIVLHEQNTTKTRLSKILAVTRFGDITPSP